MTTRLSKDINSNVLYGLPFAKNSISFTLAPGGAADIEIPDILKTPLDGKEVECFFNYTSAGAGVFVGLNTGAPLAYPVAYVGPTNYDDPPIELNPIIRYGKPGDIISLVTDLAVTINVVFRAGQ